MAKLRHCPTKLVDTILFLRFIFEKSRYGKGNALYFAFPFPFPLFNVVVKHACLHTSFPGAHNTNQH
jgi:hypothetical protein